jgi:hypothetical protein
MNPLAKAQALATAEIHNESIEDIIPRYRSVTTEYLRTVAAEIFNPAHAMTLIYRPE